jgi:hypothetical protein
MIKQIFILIIFLNLTLINFSFVDSSFSNTAFARKGRSSDLDNYERYKSYNAPKKKHLNDTWKKFKEQTHWDELSDKERSELKRKVLKKRR